MKSGRELEGDEVSQFFVSPSPVTGRRGDKRDEGAPIKLRVAL